MPTYEYVCTSCHRHTEVVQGFSDPPLTECPHCGGTLRRVFHPVGIVLKGSGFYTTDNRSSRKTAPKPKEPASTDAPSSATETKSEQASAKKADAPAPKTKTSEKK